MAWVTWRQHRQQAVWGFALVAAVALAELVSELPIRAAYHRQALASCLPPSTRSGCDIIVRHFQSEFATGVNAGRGLVILPALVGLFVGAPLLARELEHGTYRLAWTQSVTRRRWLVAKTALLGLGTIAAAGMATAATMWWRHPFDTLQGRMVPSGFDIEGLVVPAYALFALAIGVLAGLLLRRTVAAMTVTLVVFVATRLAVERFARPHYLSPLRHTASGFSGGARPGDWVLSNELVDAAGRQITAGREDLAILHAQQGGIDPHDYIATLGWRRVISFQPADRFWTFQMIEAGIFVALALAVIAVTVWLIRRTPS
jgi:ABC-2 family transporter protein